MDRFNSYSWVAISFEKLQDNLFFATSRRGRGRMDGDVEGNEEEEKEEGRGSKRRRRFGWGYKWFCCSCQVLFVTLIEY